MLLDLFWAFLQIGLFSIGGGYAALPLIQEQVINKYGWITMSEFTDLITISQMTPGPIAINSASFIGARMAGIPGALVATAGCILPSCIIVMTIAALYKKYSNLNVIDGALKGLRPAVVGMIAAAGYSMIVTSWFSGASYAFKGIDIAAVLIFFCAFLLLRVLKPIPIAVMSMSGLAGLAVYGFYGNDKTCFLIGTILLISSIIAFALFRILKKRGGARGGTDA